MKNWNKIEKNINNINNNDKIEIIDQDILSEAQLESFSYTEAIQYDKRGLSKTYLY